MHASFDANSYVDSPSAWYLNRSWSAWYLNCSWVFPTLHIGPTRRSLGTALILVWLRDRSLIGATRCFLHAYCTRTAHPSTHAFIQVYVMESYGRVLMRRLVYASDASFSLSSALGGPPRLCRLPSHVAAIEVGEPLTPPSPGASIVIKRRAVADRTQTFLPRRFLRGSLPDALLDTHSFWQDDEEGIIIGERAAGAEATSRRLGSSGSGGVTWGEGGSSPVGWCGLSSLSAAMHSRNSGAEVPSSKGDGDEHASSAREPCVGGTGEGPAELYVRLTRGRADGGVGASIRRSASGVGGKWGSSMTPGIYSACTKGDGKGVNVSPLCSGRPILLVPLLCASLGTKLEALRSLLARLDDLSHVLVWAEDDGTLVERDGWRIRLIELPRLGIGFQARMPAAGPSSSPDGSKKVVPSPVPSSAALDGCREQSSSRSNTEANCRLYCIEHPTLFLSDSRPPAVLRLLRGLPHAVILEDDYGSLFVLLPATARPVWSVKVSVSANSQYSGGEEEAIGPRRAVLLRRDDKEWISALGSTRHHLCQVHPSGAMLTPRSLAATLHLLIFRALHSMYAEACNLARACAHDGDLSAEEAQLLGCLSLIDHDNHPDCIALRLRLSVALRATSCENYLPWSVAQLLPQYVSLWPRVSAACRLAFADELTLLRAHLEEIEPAPAPPRILHHVMLLQAAAAANASGTLSSDMWLPAPVVVEPIRALNFDTRLTVGLQEDNRRSHSSVALDGKDDAIAHVQVRERNMSDRIADIGWALWTPPATMSGAPALAKFNEVLNSGVTLANSFLLIYALLCGQIQLLSLIHI